MALKAILESLDGLHEDIQKEYKKGEDGKFYLDLEGVDDHPSVGALRRAKQHEKETRQKAEERSRELQAELETRQAELDNMRRGAIPRGDVEALENSYKERQRKREEELTGMIDGLRSQISEHLIDSVARDMAARISTVPSLMAPHIARRLVAEEDNGRLVTRVLGRDGKPSALTVEELEKELLQDRDLAAILVGSKASGGGASGGSGGGGATKTLADMSESERAELARTNPAEFRRKVEEARGAQSK